ncbi:unnamed protein product [Durusdinium trenchii]
MSLEDAQDAFAGSGPSSCSMAPADTILLVLPVHPRMIGHLTSEMIWLLGALSWFHGPTGKKLLAALWRAAGEHMHMGKPPSGLRRNTTEVLLAPSPGRATDLEDFLLKDIFSLLSDQPIRTLLPNKHSCRCYRKGAVWGYVEVPFSGPGDFTYVDSAAIRYAVAKHILPSYLWRPRLELGKVRAMLVDRCSKEPVQLRSHTPEILQLLAENYLQEFWNAHVSFLYVLSTQHS